MREEDEKLREAVELYGARWSKVAEAVGTRNGDQCWKRWYDCLDPRIDKSPWTAEEVRLFGVSIHNQRIKTARLRRSIILEARRGSYYCLE